MTVTVKMDVIAMNSRWQEIYDNNKKIDEIFHTKYKNVNDYKEKNYIGFLVELGEFVNETKCFKYWTIKAPNMELVLDEYADCVTGILTFYNDLNMVLDEIEIPKDNMNILEVINNLYKKGTELMHDISPKLVKDIFINLLYLGKLLSLDEDAVLEAIKKKQDVVLNRLNSNY